MSHIKLPLYSAHHQEQAANFEWIEIGEAVKKGIVDN